MSTYTQSLGLELITPGSQAGLWGNTTNNSLTLIDQAVTGVTPISFASASGSTHTLTDYNGAEDEARSAVLNITGTAVGSNTVIIPNKQKTYLVRNNTGQDVVFQTASASATYTVGSGYSILIFCDGNNNVYTGIQSPSTGTLSVNGGGTGATTFTAGFIKSPGGTSALTSSSTVALGSEVSGTLAVANGGTGAVSLTSGSLLIGNGTGAVASLVGGTAGYVATWNGSTWVSSAPASSGVTSFNGRVGVVTPQSGDYSSYYYSASNPSGFITSSALSGYAPLASPSFSGTPTSSTWAVPGGGFIGTGGYPAISVSGYGTLFSFQSNGNGYASGSWISASDARIKENVTPITSALSDVAKLNPVKFSMKADSSPVPNRIGLIAQELETVYPEVVHDSGMDIGGVENAKAVSYSDLVPVLIKAIQELKAEVDALKAAK